MRELEHKYYAALRRKHNKAAVLPEVTIPDEEEELLYRSAYAKISPYMKRKFRKEGVAFDAEVPDDYNFREAKLTRRIDFLMFEGPSITAIEMKISKADFRRDTEAKRKAWKRVVNKFVYLTPKGLLKVEDIPEGCGLWEYENGLITVVKKAKIVKEPAPLPASMMKYFAWRAFIGETNPPKTRRTW